LSVALSGTVLSRCPACARNFANIYCQNICSPDQSLFTNVTRVATLPAATSHPPAATSHPSATTSHQSAAATGRSSAVAAPRQAVLEYQCFYRRAFAD
ncbi:NPCL1 protein, partial [Nycticryphes semicollaris]|nr:NPCL1 protein [Nycticryphes semicollaris]